MFEALDDFARTLPRPALNGDPHHDHRARRQHIANGVRLRSEAFACIGRAIARALFRRQRRRTAPAIGPEPRQV